MKHPMSILAAVLAALILAAPAGASPLPDAAPQAHHRAVLLPACPRVSGLSQRSYVEGIVHGRVVCASVQRKRVACKRGYHHKLVKKRVKRHGRWVVVRRHRKIVRVKQGRCVKNRRHHKTPQASSPTLAAPVTTAAPAPVVRAKIDPSFTQSASDPLDVTWTYSATSNGTIPAGVLTLQVQQPNNGTVVGGCSMDVAGSTTGGTCTVNLDKYGYGDYQVTVTYTGNDPTVAPATSTDTETISQPPVTPPPPPAPITITKVWGTDAPSDQPTASAYVIGSNAAITVTDANYEGATSLTVSDQNGDSCTATVSGTKATCTMTVGATPTRFDIHYPGGTSTSTTDPTTQQVTTTNWPAQTVNVSDPTVTVQQATVEECGGYQQGGPLWAPPGSTFGCGQNPGGNLASGEWPDPITVATGERVELNASAIGSLASDPTPQGSIGYTITGPAAPTFIYDQQTGASNCSASQNNGGQAVGSCLYTFGTPGTYTVTVGFTSGTADYASVPDALSETINVQ